MHRNTLAALLTLFTAVGSAAYAQQPPVSGEIIFASGGGESNVGTFVAVNAVSIEINLPRDGTINPINTATIITGPESTSCVVSGCDAELKTVVLSCGTREPEDVIVTPGGPGEGGIGAVSLATGQIVTICSSLPMSGGPDQPAPPDRPMSRHR